MRFDTRLEFRLGFAMLVALMLTLVSGCAMVGGGGSGPGGNASSGGSAGGAIDTSSTGSARSTGSTGTTAGGTGGSTAGSTSGALAGTGDARDTLDGTAWTVTRLHGAQPETPVAPAPTMRFEYGRVSGSDGCNRYTAGYRSAGDGFELLGNMVGTKRMCPDAQMRTASAFTAALNRVRAVRHQGAELLLLDGSGVPVMTLARDSQELANTRWRVTGYNNGRQAVVSVITGTELTMNFGADGRVAGSAGCNDFTAGYRQDGENLSITAPAATRRACAEPEGVMAQEASFLGALSMVDRARIEGDQLELRSAGGELSVSLERVAGH